jgi:hypothetical protein
MILKVVIEQSGQLKEFEQTDLLVCAQKSWANE